MADTGNHRIQKFNPDGVFISIIGLGQGLANGQFLSPAGIAIDSHGDIYVADTFNNRVQKFNPDGTYDMQWGSYGSAN